MYIYTTYIHTTYMHTTSGWRPRCSRNRFRRWNGSRTYWRQVMRYQLTKRIPKLNYQAVLDKLQTYNVCIQTCICMYVQPYSVELFSSLLSCRSLLSYRSLLWYSRSLLSYKTYSVGLFLSPPCSDCTQSADIQAESPRICFSLAHVKPPSR
jgi:hypothetical protein